MLIQAWHRAQGNTRTKMLIPDTAHGTNPASAALCGFSSVKVPLGPDGILTVEDVAALMDDDCAGIMITNPNCSSPTSRKSPNSCTPAAALSTATVRT